MLSQPATKIFLRTDEAHSAKWISQTIGDQEIERLRESRTDRHFPSLRRGQRNQQLERTVEPLVMASEIAGLSDLHGYVKSGNLVVRLSFPYLELPQRHEAFIERALTNPQLKEESKLPKQEQARKMPPPIPPKREQPKPPSAAQAANDDLPFLE